MKLIDKDALVAEKIHKIKVLEAFIKNFNGISDKVEKAKNKIEALNDELLFIENLEVKEIDVNKEISQFIDANFAKATIGHKLSLRRTAKYFFELGLRASNSLTWEDVRDIMELYDEVTSMDYCNDIYEEVLKRFKVKKGE